MDLTPSPLQMQQPIKCNFTYGSNGSKGGQAIWVI